MSKARVWGEVTVHGCNNIEVSLYHEGLESRITTRWLNLRVWSGEHKASFTMFFESQQDQDAVIQQLYSEVGKLLPKF